MSVLLNSALVRARRLQFGLSERQLSAVTGLRQSVIRRLQTGTNHNDLTIGELTRLATVLTVDITQLLTAEPATASEDGVSADEHLARVSALLYDVKQLIPVETLAATTGHTLNQTDAVLDAQLRAIGLRVHRLHNTVRLCADVDGVDADTLRRTWRKHLGRRGLNIGQIHTLHPSPGRKTKEDPHQRPVGHRQPAQERRPAQPHHQRRRRAVRRRPLLPTHRRAQTSERSVRTATDSTDPILMYDRTGSPITLMRYIELHGDDTYRIVGSDAFGHRRDVTAWLGMDHGPLSDSTGPLIFGTLALEPDGRLWQGQDLLAATEVPCGTMRQWSSSCRDQRPSARLLVGPGRDQSLRHACTGELPLHSAGCGSGPVPSAASRARFAATARRFPPVIVYLDLAVEQGRADSPCARLRRHHHQTSLLVHALILLVPDRGRGY